MIETHQGDLMPPILWFAGVLTFVLPLALAYLVRRPRGADRTEAMLSRASEKVRRFIEERGFRVVRGPLRGPLGRVDVGFSMERVAITITERAEESPDAALSFQLARGAGMLMGKKATVAIGLLALAIAVASVDVQLVAYGLLPDDARRSVVCAATVAVEVVIFSVVLLVAYHDDVAADRFATRLVGDEAALREIDRMIDDLDAPSSGRPAIFRRPLEMRRDSLRRWIAGPLPSGPDSD